MSEGSSRYDYIYFMRTPLFQIHVSYFYSFCREFSIDDFAQYLFGLQDSDWNLCLVT